MSADCSQNAGTGALEIWLAPTRAFSAESYILVYFGLKHAFDAQPRLRRRL
jgi:hypothetical protein